jgi:hypothetical protein
MDKLGWSEKEVQRIVLRVAFRKSRELCVEIMITRTNFNLWLGHNIPTAFGLNSGLNKESENNV